MKLNFFVACTDKMVDYVGTGGVSTAAAEPLVAGKTLDNTGGVVDTAIAIGCRYQYSFLKNHTGWFSGLRASMNR